MPASQDGVLEGRLSPNWVTLSLWGDGRSSAAVRGFSYSFSVPGIFASHPIHPGQFLSDSGRETSNKLGEVRMYAHMYDKFIYVIVLT